MNKMKKNIIRILALTLVFITVTGFSSVIAAASETTVSVNSDNDKLIYDDAGLLNTDEYSELNKECIDYGNEAGIKIFILTHDDPKAVTGETYIENFYDKGQYGDSVFLLIDMQNRDVVLEGYGKAENYLHSKRLDVIRDEITPYLSNADYYTAFDTYIKDSASYMKDDSELNYDSNYSYDTPNAGKADYADDGYYNHSNYTQTGTQVADILTNVWFQLIVSLIIGGIAVGIMAYNSGGRMTAGGNTYLDPNHSGLIGRQDNYIRTTVTRIRKPTQNNSGRGGFNAGGFRGGISAGGSSHSTSSGKF